GAREQGPAVVVPGGLPRGGGSLRGCRRLLLFARRFFSLIVGEILVVLLRQLGLTLEVELFGGERGFAFTLQLDFHLRRIDRLFEPRLAPVGHGPAPSSHVGSFGLHNNVARRSRSLL